MEKVLHVPHSKFELIASHYGAAIVAGTMLEQELDLALFGICPDCRRRVKGRVSQLLDLEMALNPRLETYLNQVKEDREPVTLTIEDMN